MKKIKVVLLTCVMVMIMAACSAPGSGTGNKELDKEVDNAMDTLKELINNASTQSEAVSDVTGNTSANGVAEPVDPKTVDYSQIGYELGFDDGAKMKDFMSEVQAGKYDNTVVKITGIMSRGNLDKTTNSVMLKVGDGAKLGISWRIVGAGEGTEYPMDGNKIELTGVILSEYNEAWMMYGHYLYVLPENVKDLGAVT